MTSSVSDVVATSSTCKPSLVWTCLRFRRQDLAAIHFTDELRFHLDSSDGRCRLYRWEGERYAVTCVVQRSLFGGGSMMVWGGITAQHRTKLEVINGNLTGIRYRDEVFCPHVLPFLHVHHTSTG